MREPIRSAEVADHPSETLRQAAIAVDKIRGPLLPNASSEATRLWEGLMTGRWSLIDHFDTDGRRFLVARKNAPSLKDLKALTPIEQQVVWYAARGCPYKFIGNTLGFSISSTTTHLRRALKKLGLASRLDLTPLISRLPVPESTSQK